MLRRLDTHGAALLIPVIACIVVAAVLFASDGSGESESATTATAAAEAGEAPTNGLLDDRAVLANRKGTPGFAAMSFWQAVQFEDYAFAYDLLTSRLKGENSPAEFARLMADAGRVSDWRPSVVAVRQVGEQAAVRLGLTQYRRGDVQDVSGTTIGVRRAGGQWRVDDLTYFETRGADGGATAGSRPADDAGRRSSSEAG